MLSDGVVGVYTLDIPANAKPGQVTILISNLLGASLGGDAMPLSANSLNFVLARPISKCDLNGDDTIDALDVQLMVSQILGLAQCSAVWTATASVRSLITSASVARC